MPIRKYRTFDEAEIDLICPMPDGQYFRRVARLLHRPTEGSAGKPPHGILKYRTMEEADQEAEKWLLRAAIETRKRLNRQNHDRK